MSETLVSVVTRPTNDREYRESLDAQIIELNGMTAAQGILQSSGQYVVLADDRITPEFITDAAAILDERPDIGIVYGQFTVMDGVGRPLLEADYTKWPKNSFQWRKSHKHLYTTPFMFRRILARLDNNILEFPQNTKGYLLSGKYAERLVCDDVWEPALCGAEVTVFTILSRRYTLESYFRCLAKTAQGLTQGLTQDLKKFHLILYDQTDDEWAHGYISRWIEEHEYQFVTVRHYIDLVPPVHNAGSEEQWAMQVRAVRNCMTMIRTPLMVEIEDDTVWEPIDFEMLLCWLEEQDTLTWVSGLQIGRHEDRIPGAWQAEFSPTGRVQTMRTMTHDEFVVAGLTEVQGGGWYFWAGRTDHLKTIEPRFDTEFVFGPDVCFVLDLFLAGYRTCVDASIQVGHIGGRHGTLHNWQVSEVDTLLTLEFDEQRTAKTWPCRMTRERITW